MADEDSLRGQGRPTKLTPELRAEILRAFKAVRKVSDAACVAGVHPQTVWRWMRDDEVFASEVKQARHQAKADALLKIRADEDWKASAWWLSHMFPKEFAERSRVDVHVEKTQMQNQLRDYVGKLHDALSPAAREELAKALIQLEANNPVDEEALPE